MTNIEIENKLCAIAESTRGTVAYDLPFKVSPTYFFKLVLDKKKLTAKALSKFLYG